VGLVSGVALTRDSSAHSESCVARVVLSKHEQAECLEVPKELLKKSFKLFHLDRIKPRYSGIRNCEYFLEKLNLYRVSR